MTWRPDISLPELKITVVVPAYNESTAIRQVLLALIRLPVSVVLIDDCSEPSLYSRIADLPVKYLRHRTNLGQGAAIQTGIDYARKLEPDIIITFDADGQHNPGDIANLVAPIMVQQADIVLGSRFLPDSNSKMSVSKKMVLQLARLINFLLCGLLLTDAHNGMRALSRKAYEKINISENRMAHASEILFEIKRHRLRFTEVPVHIYYTEYSKQKGQQASEGIKILFDLILHKLFR